MPNEDATLRELHKGFLEEHARRKQTGIFGTRKADEALMAMCEYWKSNTLRVSDRTKQELLKELNAMDLLPYRAYCREHLLDIGITNV
ncbi:MAG TPA: hypothetical protein VI818_02405 [Candidatus Thermoplasmatota archaeon]|nr:hypothetical protein [Candidatus Thermoplasmatota archaeon]